MGETKEAFRPGFAPRQKKRRPTRTASPAAASPGSPQRQQADRFVQLSTQGAWGGIRSLVLFCSPLPSSGPAVGWWDLATGAERKPVLGLSILYLKTIRRNLRIAALLCAPSPCVLRLAESHYRCLSKTLS